MNKNKLASSRLAIVAILTLGSIPEANAEPVLSLGYYQASYRQFDVGYLGGTIGYRFGAESSAFSWTPELRLAAGVADDTETIAKYFITDADPSTLYGLTVRGQWQLNPYAYLFVAPSYTRVDLDTDSGGVQRSRRSSEFGLGAGLGYQFLESTSVEAAIEQIDEDDILSVALRFRF